jgi:DNA mismatch repair protein MutS2
LAVNISGVENGSLDFDRQNLRPTYRFRMGVPGLSYAIETARKLGVSDDITIRAESLLDRSERKLSGIITELSDRLQQAEIELGEAKKNRISYDALVKLYTKKLDLIEKEKKQIKKESLDRAEKAVQEAREEINRLIDEAKRSDKKIESLRVAKHKADERIDKIKDEAKQFIPIPEGGKAVGEIGEKVFLPQMNAQGEILEKPDKEGRVRVRIGSVTLLADLGQLIRTGDGKDDGPKGGYMAYADLTPSMEIDLRGLTFDEAQPLLDKYLDDVYLTGLENVSVIHGKGTGALRIKIQNYLKTHDHVKSFRLGNWDEGSYGVTIVEMKRD